MREQRLQLFHQWPARNPNDIENHPGSTGPCGFEPGHQFVEMGTVCQSMGMNRNHGSFIQKVFGNLLWPIAIIGTGIRDESAVFPLGVDDKGASGAMHITNLEMIQKDSLLLQGILEEIAEGISAHRTAKLHFPSEARQSGRTVGGASSYVQGDLGRASRSPGCGQGSDGQRDQIGDDRSQTDHFVSHSTSRIHFTKKGRSPRRTSTLCRTSDPPYWGW